MSKTYFTQKSKAELLSTLDGLEEHCGRFWKESLIFPIHIEDCTTLRVKSGKITTKWILNLDVPGEITVRRCATILDGITLMPLLMTDAVFAAVLFGGEYSLRKLGLLLTLILAESLVFYWGLVKNPAGHVRRFIADHLGGF